MTPDVSVVRKQIYDKMVGFDAVLVDRGHHPLEQAWQRSLRGWLVESPARTYVLEKGRRIGASTIVCPRLIVAWILTILPLLRLPPGEQILIGLVSIGRSESSDRLPQIAAVLDALGIPYDFRVSDDEIVLRDLPVRIAVLTRNWRLAVGRTIGLLWLDELARWEEGENFSNRAEYVVSSLLPSVMTIPWSLVAMVSSVWGLTDYHHKRVALGTNAAQFVDTITTPVGHPALTREILEVECPNKSERDREYFCIPSTTLEHSLLIADTVHATKTRRIPAWFIPISAAETMIDASAGHPGGDPYAHLILRWYAEDKWQVFELSQGRHGEAVFRRSPIDNQPVRLRDRPQLSPILHVEFCDRLEAPFHDKWPPSRIVKQIVFNSSRFSSKKVHGDQFSEHCYAELFKAEGMRMYYHPLSGSSKPMAASTLRKWCDSGTLAIAPSPCADALCDELISYQEIMTSGGGFRYSAPEGMHDDLVACLLQAALADAVDPRSMDAGIRGSRLGYSSPRGMLTSNPNG